MPLTFEPRILEKLGALSGIAVDATVSANGKSFREAMLFTHRGLSGPAILQISSYWREGDAISLNLLPDDDVAAMLKPARTATPRSALQTVLAEHLPKRLAQMLAEEIDLPGMIGDFSDKKIAAAEAALTQWTLKPTGSEGYRTAEVTLGGVDTAGLNSATMEARTCRGFISSAKSSTSPAGSAATISSGPGPPAGPPVRSPEPHLPPRPGLAIGKPLSTRQGEVVSMPSYSHRPMDGVHATP